MNKLISKITKDLMANICIGLILLVLFIVPTGTIYELVKNYNEYQNKLNDIKIGSCYKVLGDYGYSKIIEITKNYVVLDEVQGTRNLISKEELLKEYYIKVKNEICEDKSRRFD